MTNEMLTVAYRDVLIELDQMRTDLIARVADCCHALTAIDHYRNEVQRALHEMRTQA